MKFIIVLIFILIILIALYLNNKKVRELEEEQRIQAELKRIENQKQLEELNKKQIKDLFQPLQEILVFNDDFDSIKNKDNYLSNYDVFNFTAKFNSLYTEIKAKEYRHLPKFESEINLIDKFLREYSSISDIIRLRNYKFIENELKISNELLSNIEGKSLDNQQRRAIVINEDNNLIIAGAGSGKTTTIAGKVKYLTNRQNVKPEQILLLSFTRKSAEEMTERIQQKMNIPIPCTTFHKLGLDIIAEARNEKPSIYDSKGKTHLEILASFLKNAKLNEHYFNDLVNFLAYHLKPYKDIHDFNSDAEHNNYLKEQKLEGYKMIEKITAEGDKIKYRERFKSQEEVLIANFLFRNNIEYRYADGYQYKTASKTFGQYKPDFYLPKYEIYIEHFGIDENGKVPNFFKGDAEKSGQQKYTEGIEWKRNEHENNGTTLIESYSWEQNKGLLLSNLQNKLEKLGVFFNPMSDDELWDYIEKNTPEDIDLFTQLLNTFLVLFKSNNEKIGTLLNKAKQEENQRAELFLKLFNQIYINYESYLKEQNEIDFSDMINIATKSIQENKFISNYKYIIIDEFQDISQSRFQLIKAFLDQQPDTKLFCVGDDWQSIYRFAGSDIGVFTGFSEYFKTSTLSGFERATTISYIENTYRFDDKLIELSSNFILKNTNQMKKSLKSNKQSNDKPITIHRYNDVERKGKYTYQALNNVLEILNEKEKNSGISILLLGRYDFERKIVEDSPNITKQYNDRDKRYDYTYKGNKKHAINFLTVHTSKGLEADYVVILNGNSGTYGFPSEISDDPLLNFLLSKADQFPNGEERRLFYVALTRAKKHVHVLSSTGNPSKFVSEIEVNEPISTLKCEWCDNGELIERKGPYGHFYACNNTHYCNYTRKIEATDFDKIADEYSDKNDHENAIKYFQKSLGIVKDNAKTYFNLARSFENASQYEKALECYNSSIAHDGKDAYAYYWRASVLFELELYEDAIIDWVRFDNEKSGSSNVHYWIAKSYYNIEQYGNAISYLDKALILNDTAIDCIELKNKCVEKFKIELISKETVLNSNDINDIKNMLQLAIENDLNVKFNYHKSVQFDGGIQSLRTIKPSKLETVGNSLCIDGYCYMRKEDRTFNIERISHLIINPKKVDFWSE